MNHKILFVWSLLSCVLTQPIGEPELNYIVDKINADKTSSWRAGRNPETEKMLNRTINLYGRAKLIENNVKVIGGRDEDVYATSSRALPRFFDARVKWPACKNIIDNVRHQGECGSCWALHAASIMSDRICIGTGGSTRVDISTEDILSCCTDECVMDEHHVCIGGYAWKAFEYLRKKGAVTENCKPYSNFLTHSAVTELSCAERCSNHSYKTSYEKDKYYARKWYGIKPRKNVKAIQKEIFTYGPVETWIKIFTDIYEYREGVYRYTTGDNEFNHFVKILGWGQERGKKYWLCMNSWGREWGINGLFKIERGVNMCGIEFNVYAVHSNLTKMLLPRNWVVGDQGHSLQPSFVKCIVLVIFLLFIT